MASLTAFLGGSQYAIRPVAPNPSGLRGASEPIASPAELASSDARHGIVGLGLACAAGFAVAAAQRRASKGSSKGLRSKVAVALSGIEPDSTRGRDKWMEAAEGGLDKDGQVVTPWEVEAGEGGVDYDKLIDRFGCDPITSHQIDRFETLTGKRAHRFLRRGVFFSHRDLDELMDAYEKGEPFYLYTGRGPSSESLHLGHLMPFFFTKWLQEAFDVPLVIELTDDEKFLFKQDLELEDVRRLGFENARDIIACGFDPKKTFIFRDTDYIRELYPVALEIQKRIPFNLVRGTFGFTLSDNIGKIAFPAIQAAPAFSASFPAFMKPGMRCLIPQAIDQDPYFRVTRQIAPKLRWPKPALIHAKFLPALQGAQTKMSASLASTCLYVTDTEKKIRKKINKNAFSGGGATEEEQREFGADLEKDVSYQYLRIWMEDDEELERIGKAYKKGELLTGEVKKILGDVVAEIVNEHQANREGATDEVVNRFMDPNREELKTSWTAKAEIHPDDATAAA